MANESSTGVKRPSLLDAVVPPVPLAVLIACALALFGTVTSPLVPCHSCGAFMGATLGVSTLFYLPYAVFCYASPALSVLYGFTGFRIEHLAPESAEPTEEVS